VALPLDYWTAYEHRVGSLAEFSEAGRTISAYQAATGTRFVWRGAPNAGWALHSSLFRSFAGRHGRLPETEAELRRMEREILDEAIDWGLDWHSFGGRLTALELLAALQHYGVPTRLLDFTFNPVIALWFAVEKHDEEDGRLFAVDVSRGIIDRAKAIRTDPWWEEIEPGTETEWTTRSWAWRPPPIEPRIVRQEACFLMGGIPSPGPVRTVRDDRGDRSLRDDEVRRCMSLPFSLMSYEQAVPGNERRDRADEPGGRAFTLRVINKAAIRSELEQVFGYSHRSLFPDYQGFREHGESFGPRPVAPA
jgi:hypothetical protein